MIPITADTCERAWLGAAEHLAQAPDAIDYDVIVEIARPTQHEEADLRLRKTVDHFLRERGSNPVSTVADTIFPSAQYLDLGVRGVYEVYPYEIYPEIVQPHEWGRYAQRLVHWPPYADRSKAMNPLRSVIEKIRTQLGTAAPKRACYELSLTDSAIDLPLYDPISDARDIMGGPCLSHVSLKIGRKGIIHMTALYRSHYYIARALGNFLGLAALQAFICDQTKLAPGPLVCVSSYAKLDPYSTKGNGGWGVAEAKRLVAAARAALEGSTP